jgi:hypothetical protein
VTQAEDVGGHARGIEHHEIARACPQVPRVGQQIVHLERTASIDAKVRKVERYPA